LKSIRDALAEQGITALRADDKDYHDDLFWNILTYIYGCGIGIAVFERIEQEEFNPNIAFEVGYTMALKKPVLLLKDQTLNNLNADLIGKLYKEFDPQSISGTIAPQLQRWLKDKNIIN
jgi:nucleoside 2-deoxyribosyltransferase